MTYEATETIVQAAHDQANRRTTGKKVQSQILTKLRKWKKPKNAAAIATTVATEFMPIPGVGAIIGWAEDKIASKIRSNLSAKRGESAASDYEKMKFNIKDFDVKQLDGARHKVKRNIDLYNALGSKQDKSTCERAYNIAYRYYRVENRLDKLDALASTMLEIAQDVKKWCDDARGKMQPLQMAGNVVKVMESSHAKCGNRCGLGKVGAGGNLISSGVAQDLLTQWGQQNVSADNSNNDF